MKPANFCALALCFILLTLTSAGQQVTSCTIVDSMSQAPVAYASISSGQEIIYSDVLGSFSIEALQGDTFTIRRIGYETLQLPKSALKSVILLVPKTYRLNEVVVSGSTESFEVGNHRLKTTGTSMLLSNYTHVVYIPAHSRKSTIKTVFIGTQGNSKGDVYVLSFFEVGEKMDPFDVIYSQEYEATSGKNMLEIPVSGAEVSMTEKGIFVGISRKEESDIENDVLIYTTITLADTEKPQRIYFLERNRWIEQFGRQSEGSTYKIGLGLRAE